MGGIAATQKVLCGVAFEKVRDFRLKLEDRTKEEERDQFLDKKRLSTGMIFRLSDVLTVDT